jgi:hypothetical protein
MKAGAALRVRSRRYEAERRITKPGATLRSRRYEAGPHYEAAVMKRITKPPL